MLITVYVNVPENFPLFKSCNRNQIHIFLHSWLLCFENTVGFIWLKRLYLCLLAYTLEIIAMMVFTFQCTYLLDVLWCQPIKLIHVVSTSKSHEY